MSHKRKNKKSNIIRIRPGVTAKPIISYGFIVGYLITQDNLTGAIAKASLPIFHISIDSLKARFGRHNDG